MIDSNQDLAIRNNLPGRVRASTELARATGHLGEPYASHPSHPSRLAIFLNTLLRRKVEPSGLMSPKGDGPPSPFPTSLPEIPLRRKPRWVRKSCLQNRSSLGKVRRSYCTSGVPGRQNCRAASNSSFPIWNRSSVDG